MVIYGVRVLRPTTGALNLGLPIRTFRHTRKRAAEVTSDIGADELVALVLNVGQCGVKAMALLDKANTTAYGIPNRKSISAWKNPGF